MFSIQYQAVDGTHKMQDFDSKSRAMLTVHLARFNRPIIAVYERANVITKSARADLMTWPGSKTRYAVDFINSRD